MGCSLRAGLESRVRGRWSTSERPATLEPALRVGCAPARPLVPGALVVLRCDPRGRECLDGSRRARAGVAVADDARVALDTALRQQARNAGAGGEELRPRDVDGARDVTLHGIAAVARGALVLLGRAHVDELY